MKKGKKEVERKVKAGTAWSHSYLNQKPWHPLSYPNQRRKWIVEQTNAQKEERRAEVDREFAQEQDFFRQTAQMSKKEKEKMEALQAVSFMYMRPPGYNAEAARAAELVDERKRLGLTNASDLPAKDATASNAGGEGSKKEVAKDVFGRNFPSEKDFPVLINAPRLDTGVAARVKPFAVEIRNVKCARCGASGHQSGDRECPMKDAIMPNEEARLRREDPLNAIMAHPAVDEPIIWELKQKPGGLSPARGGFRPNDPNQQIIPDEDIYDEYGGFFSGGDQGTLRIQNILSSITHKQRKELTSTNAKKILGRKGRKKEKSKRRHSQRKKDDGCDLNDESRNGRRAARKVINRSGSDYERRNRHSMAKSTIIISDSDRETHGRREIARKNIDRSDDERREWGPKAKKQKPSSDDRRDKRSHQNDRKFDRRHDERRSQRSEASREDNEGTNVDSERSTANERRHSGRKEVIRSTSSSSISSGNRSDYDHRKLKAVEQRWEKKRKWK